MKRTTEAWEIRVWLDVIRPWPRARSPGTAGACPDRSGRSPACRPRPAAACRCRTCRGRRAGRPARSNDALVGLAKAWSYQPSESSQVMITAVFFQSGCCCRKLISVHDAGLLVERIGIAGVAVLVGRQLDVGDRREIAGLHRGDRNPSGRIRGWPDRASCRRARSCSRSRRAELGRACVGLAVEA